MQKRYSNIFIGCFLIIGMIFLTGCDLLKHKNKSPSVPPPAGTSQVAVAPVAQTPVVEGALPPDVLVRIGKWTLTKQTFDDRLKLLKKGLPGFKENDANAKKVVLDELIRQQLLVQDAESTGIGESKNVKEAVEDFRKVLLVQELANRLTKNVSVSATEAHMWYDENKDKLVSPTTWNVREILTADEVTAKNILVQILQGGDFTEIAKAQSKGETAAAGGALKPFVTGQAPFPAMQTAIANLDSGGVSTVFKGPHGYYIVKVESRKGGELKSFTDVKDELISGLTLQKQQQIIVDYLNKLAQKNKVEINKALVNQL